MVTVAYMNESYTIVLWGRSSALAAVKSKFILQLGEYMLPEQKTPLWHQFFLNSSRMLSLRLSPLVAKEGRTWLRAAMPANITSLQGALHTTIAVLLRF